MENNKSNISAEENTQLMEQKFHDASVVLSILMGGIGFWVLFYALCEELGRPFPNAYMVQAVDLLGIILFFLALRYTGFSLQDLGLKSNNTKKVIIQSALLCLLSFGILAAIKAVGQMYDPSLFQIEHGFFDIRRFNSHQIVYLFTAFIQEFIARSVLQENLRRVCATKHKTLYSISHASLIFAVFHIEYGFWFMIGAAVLGAVLGFVYEKQKTVFGVWMIHWFLGVAAYLFGIIGQ